MNHYFFVTYVVFITLVSVIGVSYMEQHFSADRGNQCQPMKDVNPPSGYQVMREVTINGKVEFFWCSR